MSVGTLSFHVPDELEKRLRAAAEADRRSISSYIRIVLEDHLEKNEEREDEPA